MEALSDGRVQCVRVQDYAVRWGCAGQPLPTQFTTLLESLSLTFTAKSAAYDKACASIKRLPVMPALRNGADLAAAFAALSTTVSSSSSSASSVDVAASASEPVLDTLFPPHRDLDTLLSQERAGTVFRSKLLANRVLPNEATVRVRVPAYLVGEAGSTSTIPVDTTVVIAGRLHCNRALNGDDVAVEVSDSDYGCVDCAMRSTRAALAIHAQVRVRWACWMYLAS